MCCGNGCGMYLVLVLMKGLEGNPQAWGLGIIDQV